MGVPGSVCAVPPQPITVNRIAMKVRTKNAPPRLPRRGRTSKKTQAKLAPPPAAIHPRAPVRLLLWGCGGVVFTVSDACPVPVIELGFTKHADWVRLAGMVHVKLIGAV